MAFGATTQGNTTSNSRQKNAVLHCNRAESSECPAPADVAEGPFFAREHPIRGNISEDSNSESTKRSAPQKHPRHENIRSTKTSAPSCKKTSTAQKRPVNENDGSTETSAAPKRLIHELHENIPSMKMSAPRKHLIKMSATRKRPKRPLHENVRSTTTSSDQKRISKTSESQKRPHPKNVRISKTTWQ